MTNAEVLLRPWPRHPRFLVGNDGTILGPRGRPVGSRDKDGYLIVSGRHPGGKRWSAGGHVVVCETFHGPRPPGAQVAHANADRRDNRPSNLSWTTPAGNRADCVRHGTYGRKLSVQDVDAIRVGLASGSACSSLAAQFGVTSSMIYYIKSGKSWRLTQPQEGVLHG